MAKLKSVEIPGEFLRTPVSANSNSDATAEAGLAETDTQTVARRWWRPLSEVKSDGKRRIWFVTNRATLAGAENSFTESVGGKFATDRAW